ncbi:uncharacterized protein LOC102654579 [Apis mellifera]|uniref:Uncharacterized protein LOC102654579 n=1 Tax=Apis mellifera TaxID=7460 RepID=A0A7M7MN62_APIME|nr:uncharacterized protein LOC102654579 [Apis mellifera]|eukprot:XP_026298449.1 uncharacterized protein LOC102654579 [Apis mellifera]
MPRSRRIARPPNIPKKIRVVVGQFNATTCISYSPALRFPPFFFPWEYTRATTRRFDCEKDIQANTTTNQHRNGFHLVAKHSVTSFPHSVYTIIPSLPSRFQGMDLIKETWVQTKSARRTDSGKSGSRKLSRKRIGAVKPGGGGFYRFNISLFHDWTGGNAGYKEAEDTIPQRGYSEKLQAELKLKQKGARSMCPCTKESVLLILINCDSRSGGNVSFRINEDKLIRKCNTIY